MKNNKVKLELKGITKKFGKKAVIDNLDLKIYEGELFAILGPSGTGKSTLLKIIVGIEEPDSGKIFLDGKNITELPPNKRNIAMVFQSFALYPNMDVYRNIAFPLKIAGLKKEEIEKKVNSAAKLLGISEILPSAVSKISGGQKQRVALARALVREPSMFLLDEPFSNLDARVRFTAREELKRLREQLHSTFVYVTHDQRETSNITSRVGVLNNGKFQQIDSFENLYNFPKNRWVGDFIGNFPMSFIKKSDSISWGFRPEWALAGRGTLTAKLVTNELVGDINYWMCEIKDGSMVVLRGDKPKEVGSTINFKLNKYNIYKDNNFVKQVA
ncbi:MAG: ABC transporter ATP-binding protein [Candidatus Parvarchaeota archaeon]|nr:ABC transporter ATP-binding protein [Candidatus Parvarchaeum tengchongense]MCW1295209.1 ABC transporter ATP-binding protein [Candidatus Parvarchaeum tengchongense]MCW1312252.1 ABC transporter ATP-binding protein [Candidatus Parvarchaeum tengchongense]